ncbi:MAG TPA: bis(5'-nucleosyl)-tetraphosphatase [Candidatus Paceibacterota bacterium]|nr:bis(5'-nucleosyl)-tetraphosphatase [Candidatus Paceibacterota bacterium]
MPVEKSAGVIIFRKSEGKLFYLLLHYPRGSRRPKPYWDFPKGHIEKGEKPIMTARRETSEETGLTNIVFIKGFEEKIKYFFEFKGKTILKFVVFYLAETKTKRVKISKEHMGYKWLPFGKALKQLKFQNAKATLKKADGFL